MVRARRLFDSALIAIDRIDHPVDAPHEDPAEEISPHYSINVLERGCFSLTHRERTWHIGSTDVFLTVPGQVHRFEHDPCDAAPDDVCVAVSFTDTSQDDIRGQLRALGGVVPVVPLTNRRAYLWSRLLAQMAGGGDPIALDLVGAELLAVCLDAQPGRLYGPHQLSWYVRRVDAARERLDHDFASSHTLAGLARHAGMSPYHFARIFRELTGMPPHRYLLRRRLSVAAARLRDGDSVTDTCFAAGFQSLSHFIHTFRRAFGVSPSRFAAGSPAVPSSSPDEIRHLREDLPAGVVQRPRRQQS